jgi:predicted phosphodiesterase
LHINARVEGLKDTPDYNNEVCAEYLRLAAVAVNDKKALSTTVLINGDIIESFTGKNHPDSFAEMEYATTFAQGIFTARDIILKFLCSVNNLDKVLIVSGNHDRVASSNKEDAHGGAAHIIAEFLKLMLPEVEVVWDSKIVTHTDGEVHFICSHGDKLRNVKSDEIAYRYGDRDKMNLYLTGHYHHRAIKDDKGHIRHISLPGIFSGNTYSDHGGWTALPGFAVIYEDVGTLVVEDRTL